MAGYSLLSPLRTCAPHVMLLVDKRNAGPHLAPYQTDYSNIPDDSNCLSTAAAFQHYRGWLGPVCGPL